jgi:hypothetical protein
MGLHRKMFSLLANLKNFAAHHTGRSTHLRAAQALAFAASFLKHI